MAYVRFNGSPGETWTNDTGKVQYQLIVNWQNSCGLCAQYDHAIGNSWPIPFHYNCLLPGTRVVAPGVLRGYRGWYDGPACRLAFDDGSVVRVTANHLLLTVDGFMKASRLVKGDKVIRCRDGQGECLRDPQHHGEPTPIEDVVGSLAVAGGVCSARVPVASEDFHGDGRFLEGDVDVVSAHRQLLDWIEPLGLQHLAKLGFDGTDLEPAGLPRPGELGSVLFAVRDATDGGMSGLRDLTASFRRRPCHSQEARLGSTAHWNAASHEDARDSGAADPESRRHGLATRTVAVRGHDRVIVDFRHAVSKALRLGVGSDGAAIRDQPSFDDGVGHSKRLGDLRNRFPGLVATSEVVDVEMVHHSGPVYDVETASTLYTFGGGQVSSNCRCRQVAIYPNSESLAFVDFREKIADLDEAQRANLVGRSNLKLIDAGVVRWDDVVTQGRILDLREVVSAKRLSVERMVDAGVSKGVAEKAWESVHTLAHEQAFDVRREAIGRLRDLGVQRETARRLVAERLASRVSVAAGPSGPQPAPLPPAALAAALGVKLVPPPEPPKGLSDDQRKRWSEAYEAALQRGSTVREARRFANEAVRLGA